MRNAPYEALKAEIEQLSERLSLQDQRATVPVTVWTLLDLMSFLVGKLDEYQNLGREDAAEYIARELKELVHIIRSNASIGFTSEKRAWLAQLFSNADAAYQERDCAAAARLAKSALDVAHEIGSPSWNREADWRVFRFSKSAWLEALSEAEAAGGRIEPYKTSAKLIAWLSDAWDSGLALVAQPNTQSEQEVWTEWKTEHLPDSFIPELRIIAATIVANHPEGGRSKANRLAGIPDDRWKRMVEDASLQKVNSGQLVKWLLHLLT